MSQSAEKRLRIRSDPELNALAGQLRILPPGVLINILKKLPLREIVRLRRINTWFRDVLIDGPQRDLWTGILVDEAPPSEREFLFRTFPGHDMALVRLLAFRMSSRPDDESDYPTIRRWEMKSSIPALKIFLEVEQPYDGNRVRFTFGVYFWWQYDHRIGGQTENEIAGAFKRKIEAHVPEFRHYRNKGASGYIADNYIIPIENAENSLLIFLVAFVQRLLADQTHLWYPLNVDTCIQCNVQQAKWREVGNAQRVFCSKDCQRLHHIGLKVAEEGVDNPEIVGLVEARFK